MNDRLNPEDYNALRMTNLIERSTTIINQSVTRLLRIIVISILVVAFWIALHVVIYPFR